MLFTEMDINPQIIQALTENQIVSPTEIQEISIPHGLSLRRSHVIGQAKTGSGKTLAFAIPIIEQINPDNHHIQAVILVPTRELCKQNSTVFRSITRYKKIKIVEVYGGSSMTRQIDQIKGGGQVLIATPGRLIDLVRRGEVKFDCVNFVALDEADRMLDMGFLPDMQFLLLDAMRDISPRLFLFSATMLDEIKKLVYKFTKKDTVHEINVSKDSLTVENCDQYAYFIDENKFANFIKILNDERPDFSIIFTKTRRNAQQICRRLSKVENFDFRLKVGYINGDLPQKKREKTISMFRRKQLNCLVATNVLARGLDFPKVSHVFNYDLPRDPEDYVHRIGRTARVAGADKKVTKGKAISIVTEDSWHLMRKIERLLNQKIEKRNLMGRTSHLKMHRKKDYSGPTKSHDANPARERKKAYSPSKNKKKNFSHSSNSSHSFNPSTDHPKKRYSSNSNGHQVERKKTYTPSKKKKMKIKMKNSSDSSKSSRSSKTFKSSTDHPKRRYSSNSNGNQFERKNTSSPNKKKKSSIHQPKKKYPSPNGSCQAKKYPSNNRNKKKKSKKKNSPKNQQRITSIKDILVH